MLSYLRRHLTPPTFTDQSQTRAAELLNAILLISLLGAVVYSILLPILAPEQIPSLIFVLAGLMIILGMWLLMRRGRVRLASAFFLGLAWVNLTAAAVADGQGIRGVSLGGYMLVVVAAGLLLGGRALIGFAALNIVSGLTLVYAENSGLLAHPPVNVTNITLWTGQTVFTIAAALVLGLALRQIDEALTRARQELTERQQTEKALRQSEERLRLALDAAHTGIWDWDIATNRVSWSEEVTAIFGLRPGEFSGAYEDYLKLIHPQDAEAVQRAITAALAEKVEPYFVEHRILTPEGVLRWLEGKGTVYRDAAGQPVRMAGTVTDITERKQDEAALREAEAKYRTLVEQLPVVAYTCEVGASGVWYFVSPQIEPLLGFTPAEWTADPDLWFRQLHPDDRERQLLLEEQALATGEPLVSEYRMFTRAGREVWIRDELRVLPPSAGRRPLVQGTLSDVTERKRAAEAHEILFTASQTIAASLDLEQVYTAVHRAAAQLMSVDTIVLSRLDEPKQEVEIVYLVDQGGRASSTRFPAHRGLSGRLIATGQTLRLDDITQTHLDVVHIGHPETSRSVLAVPLRRGDRAFGMLSVQSYRVGVYSAEDEQALLTLANQAASAIENARLYAAAQREIAERKQAEETLRRYVVRMEILHELDNALRAAQSPQAIAQTAADHLRRLMDCQRVSVALFDFQARQVTYLAVSSANPAYLPTGSVISLEAFGAYDSEGMRQYKDNIYMLDVDAAAAAGLSEVDQRHLADGICCWLYAPLFYPGVTAQPTHGLGLPPAMVELLERQGELIGMISLGAARVKAFTPEQAEVVRDVANLLAVAIQQSRLFEATQRQVRELSALHAAAVAATEAASEDELLAQVTEVIGEMFYVDSFGVFLVDEADQALHVHPSYRGIGEELKARVIPLGERVVGAVAAQGRPWRLLDVLAEPKYYPDVPTTRSLLSVPLKVGEHILGVINAESPRLNAFSEADERLLTTLAGQVATALERLRAETALRAANERLEQRVAERTEELSAANAALAKAARLKDEFLASMSHELRTPLTSILAFAQILQKQTAYGPLNDRQLKAVRSIEDSGKHLLELINDILDLSKIEAGKMELEISLVSAEEVCQASLKLIRQMAQARRQEVGYSLKPLDLRLMADNRRLKQMLVNLLSNAVKFTPEGGALGLEVEGDRQQQVVRFTVWDKGIGIAARDFPKLFQTFVQLDSSLSRQYSGTGLGLALVRRMTEMHGGGVAVESEPGQGSRFTILLPWRLPSDPMSTSQSGTHRARLPISALGRALTVEDSPATAEQLTGYLTDLGVANVVYPRAEGAVEQAAELQPGVILLDLFLPDYSGWNVLAQLKADSRTRHIPVVIVSVLDDRLRASEWGANDHLVKPVARAELQQALERVMAPAFMESARPVLVVSPRPLRRRILLAEDNETTLHVLSDYLEMEGYEVRIARNGSDAVQKARTFRPELILIDVQMPGMDGLEAMRLIRREPALAGISIIALTALAMPGDRERCLAAGAHDYLTKPVNLEELAQAIHSQLNQPVD